MSGLKSDQRNLLEMPDDCLRHILNKVDLSDCISLCQTCRFLRKFLHEEVNVCTVWYDYREPTVNLGRHVGLLPLFRALSWLQVTSCRPVHLLHLSLSWANLRSLSIDGLDFAYDNDVFLRHCRLVLAESARLQQMSLARVSNELVRQVLSVLPPSVEEIHLEYSADVDPELVARLKARPRISELHLVLEAPLSYVDCLRSLAELNCICTLCLTELSCVCWSADGRESIGQAVTQFVRANWLVLRRLDLDRLNRCAPELSHVVRALDAARGCFRHDFSLCLGLGFQWSSFDLPFPVTDQDWTTYLSLPLRVAGLSCFPGNQMTITDELLQRSLSNLSHLEELHLRHCSSVDGRFLTVLSSANRLQFFKASFCEMLRLEHVQHLIKSSKSLRCVELVSCKGISPENEKNLASVGTGHCQVLVTESAPRRSLPSNSPSIDLYPDDYSFYTDSFDDLSDASSFSY